MTEVYRKWEDDCEDEFGPDHQFESIISCGPEIKPEDIFQTVYHDRPYPTNKRKCLICSEPMDVPSDGCSNFPKTDIQCDSCSGLGFVYSRRNEAYVWLLSDFCGVWFDDEEIDQLKDVLRTMSWRGDLSYNGDAYVVYFVKCLKLCFPWKFGKDKPEWCVLRSIDSYYEQNSSRFVIGCIYLISSRFHTYEEVRELLYS